VIVIFAGAGASTAVNPSSFPTTAGFFRDLPESIKSSDLFALAAERAVHDFRKSPPDIEDVLWTLEAFADVFPSLHREDNVAGWLATQNRIASALSRASRDLGQWLEPWRELMDKCNNLKSQINTLVYDYYGNSADTDGLRRTWLPLLEGIPKDTQALEVFTTNYDTVIEEAIEESKARISLGHKGTRANPRIDVDRWKSGATLPHGSMGLLTM
jgi:hypothetical protein